MGMKFEKGELVYSKKTGSKLYEVIGYSEAGSIILLPVGLERRLKNREVFFTDISIYKKKN